MSNRRVRVFLLCSGLGLVNRGYESFTRECFDALSDGDELEVKLFKGSGDCADRETVIRTLSRNSAIARILGGVVLRDGYFVEQMSFFLGLLPYVIQQRPDVLYFSDGNLGNLLWHWRRMTGCHYKLLFSNGGPLSPPFPRWDYVQQVAPMHYEAAKRVGQLDATQVLLPYGFNCASSLRCVSPAEKEGLRERLGLPSQRPVVLSVGAVNRTHKRMDYLIREIASIPAPRPFLLILGQTDEESPGVLNLARECLADGEWDVRSVPACEVAEYYAAADLFVLASLREGLSRALVEASMHGLPCLVHDYDLARYTLGNEGVFSDFTGTGRLAASVSRMISTGLDERAREARHQYAYETFSWERLRFRYVDAVKRCALQ